MQVGEVIFFFSFCEWNEFRDVLSKVNGCFFGEVHPFNACNFAKQIRFIDDEASTTCFGLVTASTLEAHRITGFCQRSNALHPPTSCVCFIILHIFWLTMVVSYLALPLFLDRNELIVC